MIPAYNEAERISSTLEAIRRHVPWHEIIVVDDGSKDETSSLAKNLSTMVIRLPRNCGKGAALATGWQAATGEVILTLDGDLGESAAKASTLLYPVFTGACDMTVAVFPRPVRKVGLGLAKNLARHGIRMLTGFQSLAPLSGQRAFRRELLSCLGQLDVGFGIEVALTVDVLRAGHRIMEIPLELTHRQTGNNTAGFLHRGKEFIAISRALHTKWREGLKR